MSAQRELQTDSSKAQLEMKELDHKLVKFQKESKDAAQKVGVNRFFLAQC